MQENEVGGRGSLRFILHELWLWKSALCILRLLAQLLSLLFAFNRNDLFILLLLFLSFSLLRVCLHLLCELLDTDLADLVEHFGHMHRQRRELNQILFYTDFACWGRLAALDPLSSGLFHLSTLRGGVVKLSPSFENGNLCSFCF